MDLKSPQDNYIDVRQLANIHTRGDKLLTKKEIESITDKILNSNETDVGVMFYYGGAKLASARDYYREKEYKLHLLQHVILGLKCL